MRSLVLPAEMLAQLFVTLTLVPVTVVFLQVMLALMPTRRWRLAEGLRPSVAVLIPAHDEAEGITATLRSIRPQLAPADRLLVVADNCQDATAAIARQAGAEVIERFDADRRGKGYALDFGISHLAQHPPEVVVIVDADCLAEAGAIERLACTCKASGRPVQALYLMQAALSAPLQRRVAEFAWLVRNWVRPLGSYRAGAPCQLMGSGMAFPWSLLSGMHLADSELVEDMKLGIDLALEGHPPIFCPEARVTSRFPDSTPAVSSQRTRWEHGHLQMILAQAPRLLIRSLLRRDVRLMALALDMIVPPMALFVMLLVAELVFNLFHGSMGLTAVPLKLTEMALAMLTLAVVSAWLGWGRQVLPASALFAIPGYVLAKIPMYLKFWTKRQKNWVRTGRN